MIEQMSYGHQFLKSNFNYSPTSAWQIDPFGHSSISPLLFKEMGFDFLVLNRIPYSMKERWKKEGKLQFRWNKNSNNRSSNSDSSILSHILDDHYESPKGFDYEGKDYENAINWKDLNRITRTTKKQAIQMVDHLRQMRVSYNHSNHLLIPFGGDFRYTRAEMMFETMERVIEEINSNIDTYGIHLQFSTLKEYSNAIREKERARIEHLPVYSNGDFHPYARNYFEYWSGYYSSRPAIKKLARYTENQLRNVEHSYAMAALVSSSSSSSASSSPSSASSSGLLLDSIVVDMKQVPKAILPIYRPSEEDENNSYFTSLKSGKKRKNTHNNTTTTTTTTPSIITTSIKSNDLLTLAEVIDICKQNVHLIPHHDAITGTSQNRVYADYLARLQSTQSTLQLVNDYLVEFILAKDATMGKNSNRNSKKSKSKSKSKNEKGSSNSKIRNKDSSPQWNPSDNVLLHNEYQILVSDNRNSINYSIPVIVQNTLGYSRREYIAVTLSLEEQMMKLDNNTITKSNKNSNKKKNNSNSNSNSNSNNHNHPHYQEKADLIQSLMGSLYVTDSVGNQVDAQIMPILDGKRSASIYISFIESSILCNHYINVSLYREVERERRE